MQEGIKIKSIDMNFIMDIFYVAINSLIDISYLLKTKLIRKIIH